MATTCTPQRESESGGGLPLRRSGVVSGGDSRRSWFSPMVRSNDLSTDFAVERCLEGQASRTEMGSDP